MTTKISNALLQAPTRKNVIINGGMDIWQRGTSFPGFNSGAYFCDRFRYFNITDGVLDATRSTDVPTTIEANFEFNYSLKYDVTTVDSSIPAAQVGVMDYLVEGYDYKYLYKQPQTLTFWAKSNKTGIYCVAFRDSAGLTSYVSEYTIDAADTWEKKTVTITTAPTLGTWDFTNGVGLRLRFALAAGTNFHTTAGAWQSGNLLATPNQVNLMDSTSNYIQITGVQLEKGTVATEFEYRPIGEELALCQRYYEKSYDMDVDPGTVTTTGSNVTAVDTVFLLSQQTKDFKVSKKSTPSITLYAINGTTGNGSEHNSAGTFISNRVLTPLEQGIGGFLVSGNGSLTNAVGDYIRYHYTAQSEL